MTSKAIKIVLIFIFSVIVTAPIQAQLEQYRANIPFNFSVGDKTFEPGDYSVYVRNPFAPDVILGIKSESTRDRKEMFVVPNGGRSRPDKPVLKFERVGEKYILTQLVSTRYGLTASKSALAVKFTRPDQVAEIALSGKVKKGK